MARKAATGCLLLAWALAAALLLTPRPTAAQVAPVYRLWSPAMLVDAAAAHVSTVTPSKRRFVRYVAFNAVAPAKRYRKLMALSGLMNSLSRSDLITLAQEVPGTEAALGWVDLSLYRIDPAAFDRLGQLGSGPAPFHEPYYHVDGVLAGKGYTRKGAARTETVKVWKDVGYYVRPDGSTTNDARGPDGREYVWRKAGRQEFTVTRPVKTAVALSPALNQATALGLAALTESNFPIFEWNWLSFNAFVEPRYHELLGLDDSVNSALRLANANEGLADKVGSKLRAAVLFSKVAERNRILERTPTAVKHGRGSYQQSYDFLTSIRAQNVLADVLIEDADANEIIFNLPNGNLAYFVADANGRRLDVAAANVAQDKRKKFKDFQVWVGYKCASCHMQENGWIEVDDEVRQFAAGRITLFADALTKSDPRRGERVRQQYLQTDYNELLRQDQAVVVASLRASTGGSQLGMTPPEWVGEMDSSIREYLDEPVSIEQLSLELGRPAGQVKLAIAAVPGLDNTLPGFLNGRRQRRDQIEVAFGQIATVLYLKP